MKLSMRNKFLLPTAILLIVALGASSAISYFQGRAALEKSITEQLSKLTESTAAVVGWWIKDRRLDVASWSQQKIFLTALKDSFVAKAARKASDAMMTNLQKSYGYYEDICLASTNGDLVAASNPKLVGKLKVADRKYFQEAMGGRQFTSNVLISKGTGKPIFVIASPVMEKDKIVGVFFAVVDIAKFNAMFIDPIKIGQKGYAYMYEPSSAVIAHPDKKNILTLMMNTFDFGRKMLSLQSGVIKYTWSGMEKIVAFRKEPSTGWTVAVGCGTEELLAPVVRLGFISLIISLIAVVVGVIVVFLTARSVTNPIIGFIDGLSAGSDRVATAADEISSSSQSLSDGTSQQAASLEETASSLEEMASMVKSNAGNAAEADAITKETGQIVQTVNRDMDEMASAMTQIAEAGGEISKIVKSIDEIAFQTNLLALNAAVEAARAGEAGMGFAVVADEVRALALRAAQAAQNTQQLVETTVGRIEQGAELVSKTQEGFGQAAASTGKLASLVSEIAAASQEQAQGIEQVNQAMTQMDQVVQKNAANAEQTAGASQEMRSQAEEMKDLVNGMQALIAGGSGKTKPARPKARTKVRKSAKALAVPAAAPKRAPKKTTAQEMKPEQVIPFDDDDLNDF